MWITFCGKLYGNVNKMWKNCVENFVEMWKS